MRFEIITLFPEITQWFEVGLLGKAAEKGLLSFVTHSPREHATDKHRTVDDAPYGGGSGMVLKAPPVVASLRHLDALRGGPSRKIMLTPQGAPFRQETARRLANEPALTFLCGRYEGFDERIRSHMDEELSLGDFVLFGGEVAAFAMIEAVARLLPGVLGNSESPVEESHSTGLLEYPHYTRPAEFEGEGIPPILLSGNHAKIAAWRREQAILRTRARRPELLDNADLSEQEREWLRNHPEEEE